ncbi:MAG: 1-acyl-sn-glycerol-3-phosphate acyltransferase [Clostridia bacterium]|nr:1-acyl-sn-glycerol-3-phosphate acyltransferase [Clostridia bacterium]
MLFVIGFILFFLPITLLFPTKVLNKKNFPKKKSDKGYVVCANHYSNADVMILDIKFGRKIFYLAKKELFKNKFISWVLKSIGGIKIDREINDIAAYKTAIKTLKDKKPLGIFPEGTRNKNGDDANVQEIKSGAIVFASKTGCPIIPVVMLRKPRVFRKNYILVGEPFYPHGENGQKLTKEEIEENTNELSEIMNSLHNQLLERYSKK